MMENKTYLIRHFGEMEFEEMAYFNFDGNIAIIIDILYNNEKEAAVFYLDLDTSGLSDRLLIYVKEKC